MYLGIDCGTQSTKIVVLNAEQGILLGEASAPHAITERPGGCREQNPGDWINALINTVPAALQAAGISGRDIKSIGVSGQQHGMVALDAAGVPVYPAKLWNDTESSQENADLLEQLGGPAGCLNSLGLVLQTGYTASKVAWLRKHHPDSFQRIAIILLPHDYLNFWLTGERVTEAGDASGTGYFDTRARCWHSGAFSLAAPELDPNRVLPRLLAPQEPAGQLRPEAAEQLGLSPGTPVSSGGGDNMMGAIGTGNIAPGRLTMSLGTSGTLCAYSDHALRLENDLAAHFCDSTGGWLPLICTMNVTSATNQVRRLFDLDLQAFNEHVATAPIGADGVQVLPFFSGERVPALPEATASIHGLNGTNMTAANLCRAVTESTVFGLYFGLEQLGQLAENAQEIRLIGGGARSAVWRQVVADTFNTPVVCPVVTEAAALGAALQAAWCMGGSTIGLDDWCARSVHLDDRTRTRPDSQSVDAYVHSYQQYRTLLAEQYPID